MTGVNEQQELFKLIGRQLKKRVECYVIGGSAMLFYGFKTVTKDIDLVFTSEEERRRFTAVLKEMGFAHRRYSDYTAENAAVLMERKEARFDLFLAEIITTVLSPGMISRIKEKHEFSNLVVNVVSPEDIIVLKCATDRAGDRKDAADIIGSMEISWDTILEEARWQAANGKKAFVIFLFDFVEDLRYDYKAIIPRSFTKNLMKEYKEQLIKLLGYKKYKEMDGK
ncbi:MAG: nucleotidyltransferase [Candidatus Aenigmatarchaeota archaeon]